MNKLAYTLTIIGITMILIVLLSIIIWKIDEARCYNMPLNDVYYDRLCQFHTITYEELNR
jgi:hypothetical protein